MTPVDVRTVPLPGDTGSAAEHRLYRWFKFSRKDSAEAGNIQTSKYECKNIQGNELIL